MSAPQPPAFVQYERRGPTARLTIDHPPLNVLNAGVLRALADELRRAESDPTARAVVLDGGASRAFAAGADIREMAPMGPREASRHGAAGQGLTVQIERLPLPVIAAVHGACLGGGCEIALACDFVVASEDAVFGQPEVNLGIMPGWGGTQRLPRRIGTTRARDWILTGRSVPAEEARVAGLVLRVVPRDALLPEALRLAEELSRRSAVALAAAKYAINRTFDPLAEEGLAFELSLWSRLFGTDGQKEGMRAFLEKRPAKVDGRGPWNEESNAFPFSAARVRVEEDGTGATSAGAKGKT